MLNEIIITIILLPLPFRLLFCLLPRAFCWRGAPESQNGQGKWEILFLSIYTFLRIISGKRRGEDEECSYGRVLLPRFACDSPRIGCSETWKNLNMWRKTIPLRLLNWSRVVGRVSCSSQGALILCNKLHQATARFKGKTFSRLTRAGFVTLHEF